jgi:hypothetical protein
VTRDFGTDHDALPESTRRSGLRGWERKGLQPTPRWRRRFFQSVSALWLAIAVTALSGCGENDDNVGSGRKLAVTCSKGNELATVLERARPGDMITVSGTCTGRVTIRTDRITVDGQGKAIIEGNAGPCDLGPLREASEGIVDVEFVQGVVLSGLTIQNSPVDGIFLRGGSAATVRDTTVKNSCDDGIETEESVMILENVSLNQNQENGINVFNNSVMSVALGTAKLNNNAQFGLQSQASVVTVDGGATLEVRGNTFIGIAIFSAGRLVPFAGSNVVVKNNRGNGVLLLDGGLDAEFATLEIAENGTGVPEDGGLTLVDGSVFIQNGGSLSVRGNQPVGVTAENGSISVRLVAPGAVKIQDNGLDVLLRFGARATVTGTIGSIVCDNTVLSQGDVTCPAAPPMARAPAAGPLPVRPPNR